VSGDGKCGRPNFSFDGPRGGNFWDGRATGELVATTLGCVPENVGTNTPATCGGGADIPSSYAKYLGPLADQAFASPFFNPQEQGLEDAEAVCNFVAGTPWGRRLYHKAFDAPLICSETFVEVTFARFAVALAAYQMSEKNNPFSSKRDKFLARDGDGAFPIDKFNDQENLGHDLFYGNTELLGDSELNTRTILRNVGGSLTEVGVDGQCVRCHANKPSGIFGTASSFDDGTEPFQTYTDFGFHNLGLPTNHEIPTQTGPNFGVVLDGGQQCGQFATTSLRNLTKKPGEGFVKAYMHNGFFKTLEQVVLFYNTSRTNRIDCPVGSTYDSEDGPYGFGCLANAPIGGPGNTLQGIQPKYHGFLQCVDRPEGWTAEEAIRANCWPAPEVPRCINPGRPAPIGSGLGAFGNLGMNGAEIKALVSYMKTLDDEE
jgi:cytochrome c peroxidase